MFRRSRDDEVSGEFEVTSLSAYDIRNGQRVLRISGRLWDGSDSGAVVTTDVAFSMSEPNPVQGDRMPASWLRSDPRRVHVRWRPPAWQAAALEERDARAAALGIDPVGLPHGAAALEGLTGVTATMYWASNAAPLPDGTAPVEVSEADHLLAHGEAGEATVLAIDFLRLAPGVNAPPGATIANLALRVQRADGSDYRALARFGFRSPERRRQIGEVGARIPVRIDTANPSRVTLDRNRLGPL